MKYTFYAKGHPNIKATHRNTLEITKDAEVGPNGDCIVACQAEFELSQIQKLLNAGTIRLTIEAQGQSEEITANANSQFCDDQEIVIRTGGYLSQRTLGTRASKAASNLPRELAAKLKSSIIKITLET